MGFDLFDKREDDDRNGIDVVEISKLLATQGGFFISFYALIRNVTVFRE